MPVKQAKILPSRFQPRRHQEFYFFKPPPAYGTNDNH